MRSNQEITPDTPRFVPCPACRQLAVFGPANPYRPFCCARCKGIDFGDWASESFRVASMDAVNTGDAHTVSD